MNLISYSITHSSHGLKAVEQASAEIEELSHRVAALPGVNGALRLTTCNRVELYLSVPQSCPRGRQHLDEFITRGLLGDYAAAEDGNSPLVLTDEEVIQHLCEVACGLDSMVVGEREISGQLRRALTVARREESADFTLNRVVEGALRISRQVAQLTGLASHGRSVVSVGLELVLSLCKGSVPRQVLLVGTGSYAGATVAALRARGIHNISVYSSSGRAAAFALGHDLCAVPATGLVRAICDSDLVITCRGLGTPVLTRSEVEAALQMRNTTVSAAPRTLEILDLALSKDVEEAVSELPNVHITTLEEIRQQVPPAALKQVQRAGQLVRQGVNEIQTALDARRLDPAVVALRERVFEAMTQEIQRLPKQETIPVETAITALHRLASRLAHTPSVKAREAATSGMEERYLEALETVFGIPATISGYTVAARPGCEYHRFGGSDCCDQEGPIGFAPASAQPSCVGNVFEQTPAQTLKESL